MSSVTAPSGTRCQPSLTNSSSSFEAGGGTGTLAIAVARECTWTVASQAAWIAITSATSGQGDGSVSYKIAENPDPVARQGMLAVSDAQVSVSQKAAPCRYDVAPEVQAIQSVGGSAPIDVHAHPACSWTASTDVAWADVIPKAGSGSATVNLIVQPNTGAERMVAAVIAGQRLTLPQRAATGTPAPTPAPSPAPSPTPTPTPPPTPTPTPPPPGPTPVSPAELDGKVDSVSGACPSVTLVIDSQTIVTTEATVFKKMPCKDIKKGVSVRVTGWRMSDGTIRADVVEKD